MKRLLKYTVVAILFGAIGVFAYLFYLESRRDMIVGNWSDPQIKFIGVCTSSHPEHPQKLIHYYYVLSQKAELKYPRVHWENTAWENRITHRKNTLAKGYGLAVIKGADVMVLSIDAQITEVFWDGEIAICKTKSQSGWFRIQNGKIKKLESSFIPPASIKNSLSDFEKASPTSAEKCSEITEEILRANLENPDGENYYQPLTEE